MSASPAWTNLDLDVLAGALERAKTLLDHDDYHSIALAATGFTELLALIDNQRQSLNRLRQSCFAEPTRQRARTTHPDVRCALAQSLTGV